MVPPCSVSGMRAIQMTFGMTPSPAGRGGAFRRSGPERLEVDCTRVRNTRRRSDLSTGLVEVGSTKYRVWTAWIPRALIEQDSEIILGIQIRLANSRSACRAAKPGVGSASVGSQT